MTERNWEASARARLERLALENLIGAAADTEAARTERNWEASARARLERLVAETVDRIRDMADQIEREGKRNVASAASETRELEFQTYPRVAGQVVHSVQTMFFNLALENLIGAAADTEAARTERLAGERA